MLQIQEVMEPGFKPRQFCFRVWVPSHCTGSLSVFDYWTTENTHTDRKHTNRTVPLAPSTSLLILSLYSLGKKIAVWEGCTGRTYRPEDYTWLGLVLSFVHVLFAAIARSPAGLTSELTELGGKGGAPLWGRKGRCFWDLGAYDSQRGTGSSVFSAQGLFISLMGTSTC